MGERCEKCQERHAGFRVSYVKGSGGVFGREYFREYLCGRCAHKIENAYRFGLVHELRVWGLS